MAQSGSFRTTDYNGRDLIFSWEIYQQSIENNTTTINWSLTGGKINDKISGWFGAGNFKVVIDGETVYSSTTRIELSVGTRVASGSKTLTHNNDGTKSFSAYVEAGIYYYAVNCSGSGSWSIEQIPRAAKITFAPTFTDEDLPEVFYTNPLGNSATSLKLSIARADNNSTIIAARSLNKTKTSYIFDFTDNERKALQSAITTGFGLNVKFVLETTIGSRTFTDSATVYMRIVNSLPTFTYTLASTDEKTQFMTGSTTKFIKDWTDARLEVIATPKKEATITEIVISNGGLAYRMVNSNIIYGDFNNISERDFYVKIVDSRGNIVEQYVSPKEWVEWFKPTCHIDNAELNTAGELTFTVSGKALNISFGVEPNYIGIGYRYKENNGTYTQLIQLDNISWGSDNKYTATYTIPTALDYRKTYVLECSAADAYDGEAHTITVKSFPIFDWGENDFNFNVPVSINNIEQDYIVESGKTGIWNWRKWNSGKAECWGTHTQNTVINTAWGAMYVGTSKMSRINYPFQFSGKPTEIATLQCGNNAGWLFAESGGNGINGEYATAIYNVCRPNAMTSSSAFYISFYVVGKWK